MDADDSSAESTSGRSEDDSWFMDYVGLSLRYLQVKWHIVAKGSDFSSLLIKDDVGKGLVCKYGNGCEFCRTYVCAWQATTDRKPKTQPGSQNDGFNFGNFMKGDLPGKLGLVLV